MRREQVVTRDLRFAGCIDVTTPIISDGDRLPRSTEEDRVSVMVSVHSDTAGFDFLAQVTKRRINTLARCLWF